MKSKSRCSTKNLFLFAVGIILILLALIAGVILFFRSQTATTAFSIYSGAPSPGALSLDIVSVESDRNVTIRTNNFPPNQLFTVTMGKMWTQGINGIVVGEIDSGKGGAIEKTFPIPAELHGSDLISIRAATAHAYPFYSFNWFYNNTSTDTSIATKVISDTSGTSEATALITATVKGGASPEPFPDLIVVVEMPKNIELGGSSDAIRFWLTSRLSYDLTPTPSNRERRFATPNVPLDATPDAPLPFAYGPQYTSCVTAHLIEDPTSIYVNQVEECKKSELEATNKDWASWYIPISGLKTGVHPLRAELVMEWAANGDESEKAKFTIWSNEFTIEVTKPFPTSRELSATRLIGIIIGPIFLLLGGILYYMETKESNARAHQKYSPGSATKIDKQNRPLNRPDEKLDEQELNNIDKKTHLLDLLDKKFDEQELRTLCFKMGIKYDNLQFSGHNNKARELVDLCARTDRLDKLERMIKIERPNP